VGVPMRLDLLLGLGGAAILALSFCTGLDRSRQLQIAHHSWTTCSLIVPDLERFYDNRPYFERLVRFPLSRHSSHATITSHYLTILI
jgi:hypothetical protein